MRPQSPQVEGDGDAGSSSRNSENSAELRRLSLKEKLAQRLKQLQKNAETSPSSNVDSDEKLVVQEAAADSSEREFLQQTIETGASSAVISLSPAPTSDENQLHAIHKVIKLHENQLEDLLRKTKNQDEVLVDLQKSADETQKKLTMLNTLLSKTQARMQQTIAEKVETVREAARITELLAGQYEQFRQIANQDIAKEREYILKTDSAGILLENDREEGELQSDQIEPGEMDEEPISRKQQRMSPMSYMTNNAMMAQQPIMNPSMFMNPMMMMQPQQQPQLQPPTSAPKFSKTGSPDAMAGMYEGGKSHPSMQMMFPGTAMSSVGGAPMMVPMMMPYQVPAMPTRVPGNYLNTVHLLFSFL